MRRVCFPIRGVRTAALAIAGLNTLLLTGLPALAQSNFWISMFDGQPASPLPYKPSTWDVQVHSRDVDTWTQLEPMNAQHGSNCSGPPNVHPISGYDQAVFQCNDHVMTAINAEGYGAIYLTPDRLVDFASGEAVVRFDMSTFRTSLRDWTDVWLSPWDDQIPLPLESWLPDLTGQPRRAIHIRLDSSGGKSFFRGDIIQGFQGTNVSDNYTNYESFLTPSATRRDTFELHVSRTSLKFGMPAYNQWWIDKTFADLGWDRAVLQLGHHSYNPSKDESCGGPCQPNTWHWDNVSISGAVPFTMLKADQPYINASSRRWGSVSRAPRRPAPRYDLLGLGTACKSALTVARVGRMPRCTRSSRRQRTISSRTG